MSAYKIAHLSPAQAEMIQELEKELDVCALAMEPGLELADLDPEALEKVKEVEEELGVQLIVYKEC